MEQDSSRHALSAEPAGSGILVRCTCGWEEWSPTSAVPITLHLAEQQLGGRHLADMQVPAPHRPEALWAFWIFVFMVCLTAVGVYLIWTW